MITPDKTSWKVGGDLWGLWVFAIAQTIVYAIQDGRGVEEAATVIGRDSRGIPVRDGWAPYRQFPHAAHQTCLAHLIRRCGEILEAHPRARWPRHVRTVLQDALAVRDRVRLGAMSTHGAAVARWHLFTRAHGAPATTADAACVRPVLATPHDRAAGDLHVPV